MDSQHRMESAFAANVPHPECRGSDTCVPERPHCGDNSECNESCARQNRQSGQCDQTCSQAKKQACSQGMSCDQSSTTQAMVEPVCQNCHKCPGTCKPNCTPRIDDGVNHADIPSKLNIDNSNQTCSQAKKQACAQNNSCDQSCSRGNIPPSNAPAMEEPVCQNCHQCPGTCKPGCTPRIDDGVNYNDVPVKMNIDGSLERVDIAQEQLQPTVAAHRPPDRITRNSAAATNITNRVNNQCVGQCATGQKELYGLSLEQQYKRALFYVRHAPQPVEGEFREHTGRIQREALYHQIEEGDNTQPQPWAIQVEEREKWDAWNKLHGLSKDQAMLQYLQKVSEIDPYWMDSPEVHSYAPMDENPRDAMVL